MAVSDSESKRDEIENENLQRTISQVETVLAVSTPASRPILETFLQNAKGRVAALEKKIKESQKEREAEEREQVAVANLVQKETALNAQEKEAYGGFLKEEFFTKKNFAALEHFYVKSWDKLSEGGKDEMSRRVWEGIRRNEYTFAELPKTVREKETDRAYAVLAKRADSPAASMIPEQDRSDFIHAYENGNREEAEKILGRDSFKNGMFRSSESRNIDHARVDTGRDADGKSVGGQVAVGDAPDKVPQQPAKSAGKANVDVSDLNLDGLQLAEASSAPSSASIPRDGGAAPGKSGASLGNG